jgi:hypothetical protein
MTQYTEDEMTVEQIEHNYSYQQPSKPQIEKYTRLRVSAKSFALLIHEMCPSSPERREAFKLLDLALMEANAAIARKKEATL